MSFEVRHRAPFFDEHALHMLFNTHVVIEALATRLNERFRPVLVACLKELLNLVILDLAVAGKYNHATVVPLFFCGRVGITRSSYQALEVEKFGVWQKFCYS